MDYNVIKQTARVKKVSIKKLAQLCDMTPVGLHQAISNKTLKIETLEKIAEALSVSVISFFENKAIAAQPEEINERLLQHPIYSEHTFDIMALNIPDKEKIKMLRERISLLQLQLTLMQQILDATINENKQMKEKIAESVKRM